VYDVISISEGAFLNNMKNSLNGLRFGFGIPKEQIKVVGALHGPANMLNPTTMFGISIELANG
jgi:hypothetical protein